MNLVELNFCSCYAEGRWFDSLFSWLRATQHCGCNTKNWFQQSRCRCHTQELSNSSIQIRITALELLCNS